MRESFDMSKVNIPYGVLHDQELKSVRLENNKMIFSFDVSLYEEDFKPYNPEVYEKFKSFKKCDMIVEMEDEPFNYFNFETAVKQNAKYSGIILSREDFIEAMNVSEKSTLIECSVSYREFKIEMTLNFYNAKGKFRKYKKYSICNITLDAKQITWNWE